MNIHGIIIYAKDALLAYGMILIIGGIDEFLEER
jgi:hypothetical protein